MGRHAEGWILIWRGGYGHVRFRHKKKRHIVSTGERDPVKAAEKAAAIYSDIVTAKRGSLRGLLRALVPLEELFAAWLESLEGSLSRETIRTYELYVGTHWLPFFVRLDEMTEPRIAEYVETRLRKVVASSVRKEGSALRGFVRWCTREGIFAEAPIVPSVPKRAVGVRVGPQREVPPELTPEEVARVLRALPERAPRGGWPVRARFVVAWETALRPATLDALSVPEHYRKGAESLLVEARHDKARYGRRVPLSREARRALDRVAPKAGVIFGRHDYRTWLRKAAKAAGLNVASVCGYDLRHARATQLVEDSANLPGVAYLLGHKNLTTTNRYLHPSRRAAERALGTAMGSKRDRKRGCHGAKDEG